MFLFILAAKLIQFHINNLKQTAICEPNDPCIFAVKAPRPNRASFIYFYNPSDSDDVRYKYQPLTETEDLNTWNLATLEERSQIWKSSSAISIYVRPSSRRQITARGGRTIPQQCGDGAILTTKTIFDIKEYVPSKFPMKPANFCVIFLQENGNVYTRNTLTPPDHLFYLRDGNKIQEAAPGKPFQRQIDMEPLYIFLSIKSQNPSFSFEIKNSKDSVPRDVVIYDKDVPNMAPDNEVHHEDEEEIHQEPEPSASTPEQTPEPPPPTEPTPEPTPQTPSPTDPTPEPTPQTPPPTDPTPEPTQKLQQPPEISTPTVQAKSTPKPTPDATWEGDWDDPPGVIIRGNDILEIQETHPPIRTEYIKTEVPKVTKYINVSCGTGVIVAIVILTVLNIARTVRRIKIRGNETLSNNDDFEDLSSSVLLYSSERDSCEPYIVE